jgi:hypothetical protein
MSTGQDVSTVTARQAGQATQSISILTREI